MLPRLHAEEKLTEVHVGLLSSGFIKKPDLRRALTRLEKAAGGGKRTVVKATPDMLRSAGIAVVVEQAPPSEVSDG